MKRHFSNRGEAISEMTAARALANRKASVRATFMTQSVRRTNLPFLSLRKVEVGNRLRKKQPKRSHNELLL